MRSFGLFDAMRQSARSGEGPFHVTLGELTDYDPATHSGRFQLPLYLDDSGNPIETGKLPIGSPYVGTDGSGVQFPIATGVQALVIFADRRGSVPFAAVLCYNDVDVPPFPDGKTFGWLDPNGVYVKSTDDAKGKGVRLGGQDYGSIVGKLIELGAEGLANPEGVVRYKDLDVVVQAFNALVQLFNTHTHTGVTTGGGVSGVPTATGQTTQTQSSNSVKAAD